MAKRKSEEEPRETIVDLVKLLAEERDIDEEEVFQAIESGIVAAYKREFGGNRQDIKFVNAEIDRESGEIYVYKLVEVVDEVLDDANEISIEDAKAVGYEDVEIGDEIEIGIGIHGEPGVNREKMSSVNEISDKLLDKIFAEGIYNAGDEVAVMVNGMGGTPLMELFVANKHVHEVLADKGIKIYKTLVGNYMTSLDMEGFSITLLKLDDELKTYLDAPADTPAFVQV
jgi:dihydroxyacetone kinase